jgi:hypothetical protein
MFFFILTFSQYEDVIQIKKSMLFSMQLQYATY